MISASIIVDTRRKTKNGYPIKIRIHDQIHAHRYINLKVYQIEKILIRTPIVVQREFQLNQELEYCNKNKLDIEQSLEVIKNGIPDLNDLETRIRLLEIELQQLKQKRNTTNFKDFYDIYIKERISEGKSIDTTVTRLGKFMKFISSRGIDIKNFKINDIDYELLYGYKLYCISNNLSIHSFKGYMQDLSLFYKEAQRRKSLFIKPENPFDDFIITTGKRLVDRNIELDDIKSFFNLQFGNDKLSLKYKQAVDLLKFQFLIGGHDFVELSHLKWTDIKNNRITFHRFKNKHRGGGMLIDNMLHPMALSIIDMYGTKDHKRIFSFIPENILNDFTYNRYLRSVISNRLKSITEINKLSFKIRTKYIRYSFRTIGGNLMINQMVLEKIMGHSNSSISMGYQGATPYEIQDAEHLKIIEAVFGND